LETIKEYNRNKDCVLREVGNGILSPHAIAKIIGVSINDVPLHPFGAGFDSFMVRRDTAISEIEKFGVSSLVSVINFEYNMIYGFVMSNAKIITIQHGELCAWQGGISYILLSIFEKFKIRELDYVPPALETISRFELMDIN